MALIDTCGIVTKETKYGDTSRILTVITKDLGKISVLAGSARRGKNGLLSATSLFSYTKFTLFKSGSSSLYKLNDGEVIHSFSSLNTSLEGLAFASYFCDITNCVIQEALPDIPQVDLLLRALYLLCEVSKIQPDQEKAAAYEKIKAVFEFRTLSINGLMPNLSNCQNCGKKDNLNYLSPIDGGIFCKECGVGRSGTMEINDSILSAISYIVLSQEKKEFSFTLSPTSVFYLSTLGERSIEVLLEKSFKTLDYLRKVTALT